jgi:hypothetical protein
LGNIIIPEEKHGCGRQESLEGWKEEVNGAQMKQGVLNLPLSDDTTGFSSMLEGQFWQFGGNKTDSTLELAS